MKIFKYSVLLGLALFSTFSCDDGFDEMQENPNFPVKVPADLQIADIVVSTVNNNYNMFVGGDMGSCWSQQIAKVQYNNEERYSPRLSIIEGLWINIYEDVIADAKTMEKNAEIAGNDNVKAIALILQAYGYSLLTDLFGDIPFTHAIKATEGNFTAPYDEQETVYNGIITMLTDANELLDADGGVINPDADVLYAGDYVKWKKFANSLKFRCLMRISGKVDVSADLQALISTNYMFESNTEEAKLIYQASSPNANPIYETVVLGSRPEFKVSDVLVGKLTGLNDPRLPVYAQHNADGEYRGKPAGIRNLPNSEYNYNNVSPIGSKYLDPTLPGYFMSYSELEFLKAEAAFKGYITGDYAQYYRNGIAASMEFNGITSYTAYLETPGVAISNTNALQRIGDQKWLALFCQGTESWIEWRRTGFPILTPAIEGELNGEMPSRYTYPTIEQSVNAKSYAEAVQRQGPDRLTTNVWWMPN